MIRMLFAVDDSDASCHAARILVQQPGNNRATTGLVPGKTGNTFAQRPNAFAWKYSELRQAGAH